MSAVIRSADETRALSSRIHSLQLSNHLDDTHATLSATALQLCSVDRTRAVTLTHTYIIPDHTVNDRTWFRAMVTRTCSVQSALQHACRVLFLVHVQHVWTTSLAVYRHAVRYLIIVWTWPLSDACMRCARPRLIRVNVIAPPARARPRARAWVIRYLAVRALHVSASAPRPACLSTARLRQARADALCARRCPSTRDARHRR